MRCIIRRTSIYGDKPCEEARKEKVLHKHIRTLTEEEFNTRFSNSEGLWKSKGSNHKIINDGKWICRDEKCEEWVANIDILEFSIKYGKIVFEAPTEKTDYYIPEVEIYDCYRE